MGGVVRDGVLRALVAEAHRINAGEKVLAPAQKRGGYHEVHLVDQPGGKVLANGGNSSAQSYVLTLSRLLGAVQSGVDANPVRLELGHNPYEVESPWCRSRTRTRLAPRGGSPRSRRTAVQPFVWHTVRDGKLFVESVCHIMMRVVFSMRGGRLVRHRVIVSSPRAWNLVAGVVFIAASVWHFVACVIFVSTRVWHFEERRGFFLPCVWHLIAVEWHITRGARCL